MNKARKTLSETRTLIEQTTYWLNPKQCLPVVYLQEDRTAFIAKPAPVLEIAYHAAGAETLVELGSCRHCSKPGTVLVMSDAAGYRATPLGQASWWNLSLNIRTETPVAGLRDTPLLRAAEAPVSQRVIESYRMAAHGYRQDRVYQDIQLKCEVMGILVALLDVFSPAGGRTVERGPATAAAIWFMGRHYQRADLSRTDLARTACLSEAQFARVFRRELGMPPMQYLRRLRLERSRQLLERTELNIAQVGQAVGFPDAAHFSRLFRRGYGCSPREYRKRL